MIYNKTMKKEEYIPNKSLHQFRKGYELCSYDAQVQNQIENTVLKPKFDNNLRHKKHYKSRDEIARSKISKKRIHEEFVAADMQLSRDCENTCKPILVTKNLIIVDVKKRLSSTLCAIGTIINNVDNQLHKLNNLDVSTSINLSVTYETAKEISACQKDFINVCDKWNYEIYIDKASNLQMVKYDTELYIQ
jgi:hypothetical protein